jgi:hypothetical protein
MPYMRTFVSLLLFVLSLSLTSKAAAQTTTSVSTTPTVEDPQREIDELRQEIRALRQGAAAQAPVDNAKSTASPPLVVVAPVPPPELATQSVVAETRPALAAPAVDTQTPLAFADFTHNLYAVTLSGGKINNPGRYLVLLSPINGATATSETPYYSRPMTWRRPATGCQVSYITWRFEYNYRAANVPYFSGPGSVTPPGGNTGTPGSVVAGWMLDLRRSEQRLTGAVLVKFS